MSSNKKTNTLWKKRNICKVFLNSSIEEILKTFEQDGFICRSWITRTQILQCRVSQKLRILFTEVFLKKSWTKGSIRGKKLQGALEQVWAVIKMGVSTKECELWSLLTVTITVPYIKQKASQTSARGGKDYRLSPRIAYITTSTIWNQIAKDHHRSLVQINHESVLLSNTGEIDGFSKFSRRTERHPLIQSF